LTVQLTSCSVDLDQRCLSLKVSSGRNSIQKLELRLTAPSVAFRYREAILDEGAFCSDQYRRCIYLFLVDAGKVAYESSDSLKIQDIANDAAVGFTIPYVEGVAVQTMVGFLSFSYTLP
jgi:hypothetical protein